jgi:hypothetical protein
MFMRGRERQREGVREKTKERKRKETVLRLQYIYSLKDSDGYTPSNQNKYPLNQTKLQSTSPAVCNIQTEISWSIIGSAQLKWKVCWGKLTHFMLRLQRNKRRKSPEFRN